MRTAAHNCSRYRRSRAHPRVPAVTRKIRRRRVPGELVVEQTRDLALVAETLAAAGMLADGVDAPGGCYLTAYVGDHLAGVIGIEARVDAALIRSLIVVETDRRRGHRRGPGCRRSHRRPHSRRAHPLRARTRFGRGSLLRALRLHLGHVRAPHRRAGRRVHGRLPAATPGRVGALPGIVPRYRQRRRHPPLTVNKWAASGYLD